MNRFGAGIAVKMPQIGFALSRAFAIGGHFYLAFIPHTKVRGYFLGRPCGTIGAQGTCFRQGYGKAG